MRSIRFLVTCCLIAVAVGSAFPQSRQDDIEAFREELLQRLEQFRSTLSAGDEEGLRALMREGKACYRDFFRRN